MKIYHGSKKIIKTPLVKGSNPKNDYGPSFYLTVDIEAAKSWACKNGIIGLVNCYVVDSRTFQKLRILDLTDKSQYTILNWLAILMHFRELDPSFVKKNKLVLEWLEQFYIDVDLYDVIIGFRADDSYFRFPIRFITNDLSFDDLEEIFMLGNLGKQYAFMSKKAIDSLHFSEALECENDYLGHYYSIVKKATEDFDELIDRERDPRKTYFLDLMRKENE